MKKLILYIILLLHITAQAVEQDSLVIPSYPGGIAYMHEYIIDNLYFTDESFDTIINSKVIVNFLVLKDGSIDSIRILKGVCCGMNESVIEMIENMPNWNPATFNYAPIDYRVTIPITIKTSNTDTIIFKITDDTYSKKATYVGGHEEFFKYIYKNFSYPSDAIDKKIKGTVILEFVVEKDGTLSNVRILKGLCPSIDKEAIKLINKSPKWIPATIHNIPVRTKYTFPIKFHLQ